MNTANSCNKMKRFLKWYCLCLLFSSTLFAGAIIEVDTKMADLGTLKEGSKEFVDYTYNLKNTGDEILKITKVKAGCSCTDIKYDSTIAPGAAGTVTARLKLCGVEGGPFVKIIKVISNATNDDILSIGMKGTLLSSINVSKKFIRLKPNDQKMYSGELLLRTALSPLKITEIVFTKKGDENPSKKFEHTLDVKEPADENGYYTYSLNFSNGTLFSDKTSGKFLIKTNHPDKKIVEIMSMLEP